MKKGIYILLFFTVFGNAQNAIYRTEIVNIFINEIGVRELTGKNDGSRVQEYLKVTGLQGNYPWCAAFNAWGFTQCDIPNPKSAWSPDWAKEKDIIWQRGMPVSLLKKRAKPGDVFTIYFNSLDRVGHTGIFLGWHGDKLITIEGNTNNNGSRLGIGVFLRYRSIREIYAITDYISPYLASL